MSKIKKLTLSKDPSEADFLVEKAEESVEYLPGAYISAAQVGLLCEDVDWRIIITKYKK